MSFIIKNHPIDIPGALNTFLWHEECQIFCNARKPYPCKFCKKVPPKKMQKKYEKLVAALLALNIIEDEFQIL